MTNERLSELLAYLHELRQLNEVDYRCNTEIAEAIEAIREELFGGNGADFHGLDNANNPFPIASFNVLQSHSTEALTKELDRRAENPDSGVKVHKLAPHGGTAKLSVDNVTEGYHANIAGPAHIYVVTD